MQIKAGLTDVCGSSDLSDYTGELRAVWGYGSRTATTATGR